MPLEKLPDVLDTMVSLVRHAFVNLSLRPWGPGVHNVRHHPRLDQLEELSFLQNLSELLKD